MIKQRISLMLPLFGFRVQYGFILDRVFLHEKKYIICAVISVSKTAREYPVRWYHLLYQLPKNIPISPNKVVYSATSCFATKSKYLHSWLVTWLVMRHWHIFREPASLKIGVFSKEVILLNSTGKILY